MDFYSWVCHNQMLFNEIFFPRMSNMKMEELNRRRSSFIVIEETLKSPQGSFNTNHDFLKSPQPSIKQNGSRQNSLRVAVQHRRASIISISQDNLLEVAAGPSRSGSFRSSSNENLLAASLFRYWWCLLCISLRVSCNKIPVHTL